MGIINYCNMQNFDPVIREILYGAFYDVAIENGFIPEIGMAEVCPNYLGFEESTKLMMQFDNDPNEIMWSFPDLLDLLLVRVQNTKISKLSQALGVDEDLLTHAVREVYQEMIAKAEIQGECYDT